MTDLGTIEEMSFEQAMAELEKTVNRLESGDTPLDESIRLFEYGSRLKKRCEFTLKAAQEKIEKITLDANGVPEGVEEAPF
ncbi:MAG: exodeoxyribonuclease VII small subunit [Rhodobacteraceae bacterium]|nr:exodeoxyribonuclease VII small subunit [Paracoccaceae bacterium]